MSNQDKQEINTKSLVTFIKMVLLGLRANMSVPDSIPELTEKMFEEVFGKKIKDL